MNIGVAAIKIQLTGGGGNYKHSLQDVLKSYGLMIDNCVINGMRVVTEDAIGYWTEIENQMPGMFYI